MHIRVTVTSLIVEEDSSPLSDESMCQNSQSMFNFCEQPSASFESEQNMTQKSCSSKYYSDDNCYNCSSYEEQSIQSSSTKSATYGDKRRRFHGGNLIDAFPCTELHCSIQDESASDEGTSERTSRTRQDHGDGSSNSQPMHTEVSTSDNDRKSGIAEYILDPTELPNEEIKTKRVTQTLSNRQKSNHSRKKPQPWYCISRPISEQTKDIKIHSVNRSSSIYYSKLLEKCRSIVEFCMPKDGISEINESNINEMNHNYSWGDSLPTHTKGNTIRVVYQNVHRSLSASDNPHTTTLLDNLNNMDADIFMASETNTNWKSAAFRNEFKKKVNRVWPANRIAYSSSDVGIEFELHEFLPGGTCTMAVDNLSMRVVKVGEDESGLGRWSYITLEGQGGRKITFITAYRICNGTMKGARTNSMQQAKVINKQEILKGKQASNPDTKYLRQKFIEDLALFIQALKDAGHAIVLGLDANETPEESISNNAPKKGSISWLLEHTGLHEVFDHQHSITPDSTTTTPGRFIDRVAVHGIRIQRVTLLNAHTPAKSDHLGIAIDLDMKYLFDHACSPLVQPSPRKLTSGNAAAVQKYIAFINKQFNEHKIVERCRRLRDLCDSGDFDETNRQQLFALDRQVTEILLGAENQCSKRRQQRNLWSPALKKAGCEIGYWKQRLSTNGQLLEGTKDIGIQLELPDVLQQPMSIDLCKFYLNIAWKSYRGIQSQERQYREKFLKDRAKEQAAKGNGDVAKALKQIRQKERLKSDYSSIRRGYGINKQGLATLDVPDLETGGRKLITNADEIHKYLLKRNEKHFSQATFTTFGDAGPGFMYIDPSNPESDQHIDDMLNGVFEPWESASPYVGEFLKELQCTVTKELNIQLHLADFKQLFKTIPENTGSSVSGLHYGHYRVLSKMEDDTIIGVLFEILNIAFKTHSPLPRWKHATQLMLEKGKGPAIENLRIIQLLEADMNWLLRFLWGRQLDRHAMDAGVYNEAQFASPGKLCQSAIVNKVLFFDLLRQTKQYGALMDNDATAAFDRVLPALCVVTCRQLGMPKSAQRFFFKILRQMVYTTTTAHGRSATNYSASANPSVPGQGVMQGGGASLPNYKSQQLPVINGYERHCIPAVFRHVSKVKDSFRRWVSGFSDDISLMLNELGVKLSGVDSHLPMAQRVKNALQNNLERYEEYFFTAGGSLNIKKCFYYLVGFHWTGTGWRYKTNSEIHIDNVVITPTTLANDNTPQQVQWHEANEAQRSLGSHIAPDGSNNRQLEVLFDKLKEWQKCLSNMNRANLQARWISYQNVFLRKLMYPLIGHTCEDDDLQSLQKTIDNEVLHILGLNEHFPRAVLRAPLLLGGMGCVTVHGQHVIDKLILMVHHFREDGRIKETLLASMGITQIECGSSRPFFDLEADEWQHLVTKTWITHIWGACQPRGIAIKFHTDVFWVPKPVREHDVCIMDVASQMYSGQKLYQINMCRIALQVTWLSDISAVDGKRVLLAYYNGKEHRESGRRTRLNWPPVGELPSKWWQLWQEFLVQWCGTALQISPPLGRWYEGAEMLTQCCFFLYDKRLLMQMHDGLYEFSPLNDRSRTRFQLQAFPCDDPEIIREAKVVDVAFKRQCIYVISQSSPNIIPRGREIRVQSLQELYRDLPPELQRIIGRVSWPEPHEMIEIAEAVRRGSAIAVSDGSVRTSEDRASQAWIIQTPSGGEITGKGPVDGSTYSRTSHRAEIQGQAAILLMLSLIVKYFNIIGGKIAMFCDNQSVVKKMQYGWHMWRYRHTKGPDSDIQSLLHQTIIRLQADNGIAYSTEWVQGHQDKAVETRSLPRPAALNVRMDGNTKEAYSLPTAWQTQQFMPVLSAEGCAVYIADCKVTSNMHLSLSECWHEKEARDYLRQRHQLSTELFDCVHWRAMRFSLKKLSAHRRATAVKAIHRHLPTQEKLFKQGRITMSSTCPRCMKEEETNFHVYCCSNDDALKQRRADWVELWKGLTKCRTASVIEQTWRYYLQPLLGIPLGESIIEGMVIARGEVEVLLTLAVEEQSAIGWDKLLLGMGSKAWQTLQEFIDRNNPKPPQRTANVWMSTAIHLLLKFSLRCWKERNLRIHGATRQEQSKIAMERVREQIKNIYADPPPLATHFRSIFDVPLAHRLRMSLQSAEQWLSLIAHQAKVTKHNLTLLLRQHKPMEDHLRTMRRQARNQARERNEPATPRKAHSRAVQAAVRDMREKLYAKKANRGRHQYSRGSSRTTSKVASTSASSSRGSRLTVRRPHPRFHPP